VVVDVNTTNEAPAATDFTDKNAEDSASSSSKTVNIGDLSELLDVEVWHDFIQQLPLTGTVYQVVNNSRLKSVNNNEIQLELLPSVEHFCTENAVDKIVEAMSETLGRKIQLVMVTGDEGLLTPRLIAERRQQQKLDLLLDEFRKNPRVNDLLTVFSGHLSKDDIQVGKKDLH
jgi:hypothetical protein